MLLINCPWCGPRDETEFRFGGEAPCPRQPCDPSTLTDAEWANFLFMRLQGPAPRALGPQPRLPPLVQRRAPHRHQRDHAGLPDGRG